MPAVPVMIVVDAGQVLGLAVRAPVLVQNRPGSRCRRCSAHLESVDDELGSQVIAR